MTCLLKLELCPRNLGRGQCTPLYAKALLAKKREIFCRQVTSGGQTGYQFRLSAGLIYMHVSCAVSQTHNGSNNAYHKARQYHLPTMQFQSIHFGQTFLLQPLYVPNK